MVLLESQNYDAKILGISIILSNTCGCMYIYKSSDYIEGYLLKYKIKSIHIAWIKSNWWTGTHS